MTIKDKLIHELAEYYDQHEEFLRPPGYGRIRYLLQLAAAIRQDPQGMEANWQNDELQLPEAVGD